MKLRIPHSNTIIAFAILFCALLSWLVPAGEYAREEIVVNGIVKTVIVENSFQYVENSPQTWQVFSSFFAGFERQAGIIAFLLIMGGAFHVLNATKSIDVGIHHFLAFTKHLESNRFLRSIGVNNIILCSIIFIFSLFGAVFGMSEETIAFTILIIPLAVKMGYDSITGVCIVYVAAHVGFSGAMLNPFTVGIAQGFANLPLFSGFEYRVFCWLVLTLVLMIIVLIYARRIKKKPEKSLMYELDAYWRDKEEAKEDEMLVSVTSKSAWMVYFLVLWALIVFSIYYPISSFTFGSAHISLYVVPVLTGLYALLGFLAVRKSNNFFILVLLGFTILFLIVGVMAHGWYLSEISAIFLAMGLMTGYAFSFNTDRIISLFQEGAKDMLSVAIVVALAGGIIQILEDGQIIDTILYGLASLMDGTGKLFAVTIMYIIQTVINLIIPSGTAKAALTMPIMAPFSDVIGVSRQATVMAFQFGDGFTNMVTPTSAVLLGVLGVARIPYTVWLKWFFKFLVLFMILGFLLLIPTVYMSLPGF